MVLVWTLEERVSLAYLSRSIPSFRKESLLLLKLKRILYVLPKVQNVRILKPFKLLNKSSSQ